jgi:hypothetical protein
MTPPTIARLATVIVAMCMPFVAFADDEACSRNHYILWSGPDHTVTKCVSFVDDAASLDGSTHLKTAVEYYQLDNERYFVTTNPTEIAALDAKLFEGWMRSGQRYRVLDAPFDGAVPICRVFLAARPGGRFTHLYSRTPTECDQLGGSPLAYEEGVVFYAVAPDADERCPGDFAPVWRLTSDAHDGAVAFAYTPDVRKRDAMTTVGYVVTRVEFCVPSSAARAAELTRSLEGDVWTIDSLPFQPDPVVMRFVDDPSKYFNAEIPDSIHLDDFQGPPVPALLRLAQIATIGGRGDVAGWYPLMDEYVVYSLVYSDGPPGIYSFVMWTIAPAADGAADACTWILRPNWDSRYPPDSIHPFQLFVAEPCVPSPATVADLRAVP